MIETSVGCVVALWRYPVKSMLGEELNATMVTPQGVLGDRTHALTDTTTGKVLSAKHPRKWGSLFDCRAAFVETPQPNQPLPAVKITLPDGHEILSTHANLDPVLSQAFGQPVHLSRPGNQPARYEYLWPAVEGLRHQNQVTDLDLPLGSFFDAAPIHLLTTASLNQLQALLPGSRFEPRRFRPNIVIQPPGNPVGFVENDWVGRTLAIGDQVRLQIDRPCSRCVMTTLPQSELPQDLEILRATLQHNQGNVGLYARVVQPGLLRRGDEVRVVL